MRLTLSALSLIALLAACGEHSRGRAVGTTAASVATSATTASPASEAPADADSSLDDECGLVREPRYDDPVALVREYVRSDTGADYGETGRYLCPDDAVGSDESRVMTRLGLEPLAVGSDTARVLVRTAQHGWMRWDSTGTVKLFVSEPAMFVDTFVAVRTQYGWRIAKPGPSIDVTPSAALVHYGTLDPATGDSLRRLAAASRSGI